MKRPKKLTRAQKIILTKNNLDPEKYGLLTHDKDTFTVVSKEINEYGNREQYTYAK